MSQDELTVTIGSPLEKAQPTFPSSPAVHPQLKQRIECDGGKIVDLEIKAVGLMIVGKPSTHCGEGFLSDDGIHVYRTMGRRSREWNCRP